MNDQSMRIENTEITDLEAVLDLFNQAMKRQTQNGYKVWDQIDSVGIKNEINDRQQFKLCSATGIQAVFSVHWSDPLIWGERDRNDALYLHRIVISQDQKGQRLFARILAWASGQAHAKNLPHIRLDTWAENHRLIAYYMTYGFNIMGYLTTSNDPRLPLQNRNLKLALLEWRLPNHSH